MISLFSCIKLSNSDTRCFFCLSFEGISIAVLIEQLLLDGYADTTLNHPRLLFTTIQHALSHQGLLLSGFRERHRGSAQYSVSIIHLIVRYTFYIVFRFHDSSVTRLRACLALPGQCCRDLLSCAHLSASQLPTIYTGRSRPPTKGMRMFPKSDSKY
jgi:hypothetical protein